MTTQQLDAYYRKALEKIAAVTDAVSEEEDDGQALGKVARIAARALASDPAPSAGPLGARLEEIERLATEIKEAEDEYDAAFFASPHSTRQRVARKRLDAARLALATLGTADALLSLLAALRSASPDDLAAAYANGMIEGHHRARHTDGSLPGSFVVEAAAKYITAESGAAARRAEGA